MRLAELIIAELNTPTGQTGPLHDTYVRSMSGLGHAVLGAAFCASFGLWGLIYAAPVALVYWLAKERGDLRRGGKFWDGVEDAIMVSLGAWYGVWWWPLAILGGAGIILASAAVRLK
jgi:hypothetical protein